MAWPPPADKRRIAWVSAPGDYATFNSNHTPDGTYGLSSLFCYLAPKRPVRSSRSLDERTREGDDQRNARAFHHYYAAVWKPYLISFMRSLGPRPHGERV
jgi:hypothetical protein